MPRASGKAPTPPPPATEPLRRYHEKRRFDRTPEPAGAPAPDPDTGNRFVVHKHAARRLHYDLRLALDGVFKSWAVPRGPSLDPADVRLAVHVEDHPTEYGDFEGIIPKGEYGGGTVMIWDRGTWEPLDDPRGGYAKGRLKLIFKGERLKGQWMLVRSGDKSDRQDRWLLRKDRDDAARPGDGEALVREALTSVASGRTMAEIAADTDRVWRGRAEARDNDGDADIAAKREPAPAPPPLGEPAPLPAFIPPQLATPAAKAPAGDDWLHEIKFDGYRLQIRIERGAVTLQTRNGHDWSDRFPHIAAAARRLAVDTAILDGEAVVIDDAGISNFGVLQAVLAGEADHPIRYYAFDLLYLNGNDLRAAPLIARKEALAALIAGLGPDEATLLRSEHLDGRGPTVLQSACQLALEGVISKLKSAPYRSGRGKDWRKSKCIERQEFVIGGLMPSTAAPNSIGSLLLGYHDNGHRDRLVYAGKVGTGFSAAQARDLRARLRQHERPAPPFADVPADAARGAVWVEPALVCEVEFAAWTRDGRVRHAAFIGLRDDKAPQEVVREVAGDTPPAVRTIAPEPEPAPAPKPRRGKRSDDRIAGVLLTNPDRIVYPDQGVTKRGLAEYMAAVGDRMLPHIAGRPLSLVRCPSGSEQKCFFQKHPQPGFLDDLQRVTVSAPGDKKEEMVLAGNVRDLVLLIQHGVLEIHPWGSRAGSLDAPDMVIFDLDPDEGLPWPAVAAAALELRERLTAIGLTSFVKTTGGKGLHVQFPLQPRHTWDDVAAFAAGMARAMAKDSPQRYTATMSKRARTGRIFIDHFRNRRGSTAIAPYSPRARPRAPVSLPVAWPELDALGTGARFTLQDAPRRLTRTFQDPWAALPQMRQSLP